MKQKWNVQLFLFISSIYISWIKWPRVHYCAPWVVHVWMDFTLDSLPIQSKITLAPEIILSRSTYSFKTDNTQEPVFALELMLQIAVILCCLINNVVNHEDKNWSIFKILSESLKCGSSFSIKLVETSQCIFFLILTWKKMKCFPKLLARKNSWFAVWLCA